MRRIALHEGGFMHSESARRLAAGLYGVHVGAYSYGSVFRRDAFPPNTSVGRYVSVGPNVRSFAADHPIGSASLHPFWYNPRFGVSEHSDVSRRPLRIEHEAWVGANALLLSGCRRIGIGAVVGAGSVVTKDVEDFTVVAGNPARVIRTRFSDSQINALLKTAWWRHPVSHLNRLGANLRGRLDDETIASLQKSLDAAN
jgi:acetyltransferase-like isoleucine patch superfamily enzyme